MLSAPGRFPRPGASRLPVPFRSLIFPAPLFPMNDIETRFGGIARLYSTVGLQRLTKAHVCVVGIGGVGSWAVEALARSGIGQLTLVDLDDVCVSNVNRQLHALDGEIGKSKVEVMANRVRSINPECIVHEVLQFFTPGTADSLLASKFDYLFDAIDHVSNKCLLITQCRDRGIPIITAGGAGGRRNPSAIRVADLAKSTHDPLLQQVRTNLRRHHGFPSGPNVFFNVASVFSPEPPLFPHSDGTVCAERDLNSELKLDCNSGYGTATFVTGTFGFMAAAHIVSELAAGGPGV